MAENNPRGGPIRKESDIKGELQEIEIKRRSSAFMKHLSRTIGEGAEEPTVDDYGINNDPIRSAYLSSYDETIEGAKHVAFSEEDEDQAHVDSAGIRKAQTFSGSLSDAQRHKTESYPHYHHVMSRHRPKAPSDGRKRSKKSESDKLPTITDEDHFVSIPTESETEGSKPKMFSVGHSDSETEAEQKEGSGTKQKSRKKRKHKSSNFTEEELKLRRARGSELTMDIYPDIENDEELEGRDLEDMTHHRYDQVPGVARHKIAKAKSSNLFISGSNKSRETKDLLTSSIYHAEGMKVDHTPHDLFVEMDELIDQEWVEQARWIKYEEGREEGAERWGKPHVSSLSFHSLLNLRHYLKAGVTLFDFEAKDLTHIFYTIVEEWSTYCPNIVDDENKGEILRTMLYKHRHVGGEEEDRKTGLLTGLRRNLSSKSLVGEKKHASAPNMNGLNNAEEGRAPRPPSFAATSLAEAMLALGAPAVELPLEALKHKYPILNRIPDDSQGALVCVGAMDIEKPLVAFVRLAEAKRMKNALEIPIPLRFVFVILTPQLNPDIDCHEVGRAMSTLLSNTMFHEVCYVLEEKDQMINAINDFLDESVVLPPGDYNSKNLLNMQEIRELRQKKKERKEALQQEEEMKQVASEKDVKDMQQKEDEKKDEPYDPDNPMMRAPYVFGGLINDLKRRFKLKHFLSDFKDGIDAQVFAAAIFIYFAALSGAIAFGGLLGEKTQGFIGISETMLFSSISGVIFSLVAGMPLIITGVTGPILLFEESLFQNAVNLELNFLAWRVWVGIWLLVIAIVVACFQGSVLVKHFTKFTKDIFAGLVSLLFLFEAFNKLAKIFKKHPLRSIEYHCNETTSSLITYLQNNGSLTTTTTPSSVVNARLEESETTIENMTKKFIEEPNTALLSGFLMIMTFVIAYQLKIFRNGHYFGRTVRRALGDFGVPLAILLMVLIDYFIEDTYTEKLAIPEGISVTDAKLRLATGATAGGWLINPFPSVLTYNMKTVSLPVWAYFAAAVPALLLYVLLFMETHICELLMMDRTNAMPSPKGAGVHWDIVLLCGINCLGSFFGGPWVCAATVRAVAHVSALTVMSTTHAPGEQPYIVNVKDQRVSFLLVSVLLGVSVALAPLLKNVPFAVLFGVFLYMGVSGINGIQLFDRIALVLQPVKHHPSVSYVRRVKTMKMYLFTLIQSFGLGVLWAVKSSTIALFFPFFVVAMIPLRMSLKFLFTPKELEALDGKDAGKVVKDDEPDFYEQGGIGG